MSLIAGGLLLFSFAQSPGDAEIPPVTYPKLADHGPSAQAFVPSGWKLEFEASGDLNGDALPDRALVLRMTDSRNLIQKDWDRSASYDSNPRMIAVLFAQRGGGYELAVSDHRLIPRLENQNQDDPLDEISIRNRTLRVKMHLFMSAGGWQMGGSAYIFRWRGGAFELIGFDRDSVMRNTGETEEISINYLTGRKQLKSGNIGSDRQQSRWVPHRRAALLRLADIGDGLMFDPDER